MRRGRGSREELSADTGPMTKAWGWIRIQKTFKELQRSGFDVKKLSIVGKEYHSEEHVIGYYNAGDRMKYWGKMGAFWGGNWGLLFGAAFFAIPGFGPVLIAGPLVSWIVGALEGVRGWWLECHRRRAVQHWHPKRQCAQV